MLKISERLRGEVNLPAINELRYAGRRIADALAIMSDEAAGAVGEEQARTFLKEAHLFCMRAEHDCVDAIALYVHQITKEYDRLYDRDLLNESCPSLRGYFQRKRMIDELIVSSRENREARDETYQIIIRDHLEELVNLATELDEAKDRLQTGSSKRLKLYQDMEARAAKAEREARIGLIVGAIGTLVGIAGFIVGLIPLLG
ncbi:hypothetical protein GE253_21730 [Niveispirillum sp. SYP-B3756]|uniref:hypothetical protein n=1 Tax=Niveispirillum sp. SYP-B3756 TaxID=2662178 RepID=UPI00129216D7|nr:hypothetical protein [Niveispirillum sp. SYP-B3756]MQP67942.1 hypothetical protein [Niveispirillum sp. SYP-B3756]